VLLLRPLLSPGLGCTVFSVEPGLVDMLVQTARHLSNSYALATTSSVAGVRLLPAVYPGLNY
jgi:hypothetical protein